MYHIGKCFKSLTIIIVGDIMMCCWWVYKSGEPLGNVKEGAAAGMCTAYML